MDNMAYKHLFLKSLNENTAPAPRVAPKLSPIPIIAKTIWGEASGEGIDGMAAVAAILYVRANGDPNKIVNVALKPRQFSFWNGKSQSDIADINPPKQVATINPQTSKLTIVNPGAASAYNTSLRLASELVSGKFNIAKWTKNPAVIGLITNRYDHYLTTSLYNKLLSARQKEIKVIEQKNAKAIAIAKTTGKPPPPKILPSKPHWAIDTKAFPSRQIIGNHIFLSRAVPTNQPLTAQAKG